MQCKLRFPLLQHMISISTRSMFPAPAPPRPADLDPFPLHPLESLLRKTLAQRFCPALTARWKIRGEKCPRNERKARDKKQNLKARYISSFRCWQSATKSEVNEAWKVGDTVISIFLIIINFIVINNNNHRHHQP